MVKGTWKSFLAGVALFGGLAAGNAAFAGDGGCAPCGGNDCHQCEQIFADAGQKLTDQLASMSCCGDDPHPAVPRPPYAMKHAATPAANSLEMNAAKAAAISLVRAAAESKSAAGLRLAFRADLTVHSLVTVHSMM